MIDLQKIKSLNSEITDEKAQELEDKAIAYINSKLGYEIRETEYVYETNLEHKIYLPNYPITEIISFKENIGTIFNENWVDVVSFRRIGNVGKIIVENASGNPCKIDYKAGYKSYVDEDNKGNLPLELEQAIIQLSKYYFDIEKLEGQIKKESVDGDSVEFIGQAEKSNILAEIDVLLDKYYRYDLVA